MHQQADTVYMHADLQMTTRDGQQTQSIVRGGARTSVLTRLESRVVSLGFPVVGLLALQHGAAHLTPGWDCSDKPASGHYYLIRYQPWVVPCPLAPCTNCCQVSRQPGRATATAGRMEQSACKAVVSCHSVCSAFLLDA